MEAKTIKRKITALACGAALFTGLRQPVKAVEPDPGIVQGTASDYIYIFDTESGQVLSEKNSSERMYPASMTKIVTAIVAIEHLPDLNRKVQMNAKMLAGLADANASVAGFSEEDVVSVEDLLYGVALPSGADAAYALAFTCSDTMSGFISMMNDKAASLGLTGTHFTNCTGLHDDNHYSTAHDMAILMADCIKNDTFARIFSTKEWTTDPMTYYPSGIELTSTTWGPAESLGVSLPGLSGSKTGFTYEAGHCLAWWADINNMHLVGVNAHADEDNMYGYGHLTDASSLLSRLHSYDKITILEDGQPLHNMTIHYIDHDVPVQIQGADTIIYDLPADRETVITSTLPDEVDAGLKDQRVTGVITIERDGEIFLEEGIAVTVPKETRLIARLKMRWNELFSKKDKG